MRTFEPYLLEGVDLLYIKLHGLPNQPFWYGDHYVTCMAAHQVIQADLTDTTVFVANCHSFTEEPTSVGARSPRPSTPQPGQMLFALLEAGARAVVAGAGPNYAGTTRIYGADILGLLFRKFLAGGFDPKDAFLLAKAKMRFSRKNRFIRDTLEFKLFTKEHPSSVVHRPSSPQKEPKP
jgi:hypothetical protein